MTLNQHVLDETLEALVMGRLQTAESERVEDHLLVCEKCRLQFEEIEGFIIATKTASAKMREVKAVKTAAPRFWRRLLGPIAAYPVWAGAGALVLAALMSLPILRERPVAYRELSLTAIRGSDTAVSGSSNVRLRLKLDLTGLPSMKNIRVTIVDAIGNSVFTTRLPADHVTSQGIEVPARLPRGSYWVRLFEAADDSQLLREYPLDVQ
jgi:hypothetical protein